MTVGRALWPDQLTDTERASLAPGVPSTLHREPDVLVVGGGMVGCATTAACVRAGLGSIVLLEREQLGAGASGGAAGILAPEFHVGVDPEILVDLMRLSLEDWRELESSWPHGVGLKTYDYRGHSQARVNPLHAIARLAAYLPGIATGAGVTFVEVRDGRIDAVNTTIGAFHPGSVVFATGNPPRVAGLSVDLPWSEVKGHIAVSEPTELTTGITIEDVARVLEDGRILVGGTLDVEDGERVVRPEVVDRLWEEFAAVWPRARQLQVEYRWACFRPAHPDHMPVIDRLPGLSNAWLTSGHYKTGILLAPATGRALAEWIRSGEQPPEVAPFASSRFRTTGTMA